MKLIIHLMVVLATSGKIAARVTRSVGGRLISTHQAPYFVSIRSNCKHICGGALVTKRHVVTAAHCSTMSDGTPYQDMTVVTGINKNNPEGTCSGIAEFREHDPIRIADNVLHWPDIAVITLSKFIMLTDEQNVIDLPNAVPKYERSAVLITLDTEGHLSRPAYIHGSYAVMLEAPYCSGSTKPVPKEHGTLCGTTPLSTELGEDDKGSPLVYKKELVGIASFLESPDLGYDYYTDVFEYIDFVRNVTGLQKVL